MTHETIQSQVLSQDPLPSIDTVFALLKGDDRKHVMLGKDQPTPSQDQSTLVIVKEGLVVLVVTVMIVVVVMKIEEVDVVEVKKKKKKPNSIVHTMGRIGHPRILLGFNCKAATM